MESEHQITDVSGRCYRLAFTPGEAAWDINIFCGDVRIGHCYCQMEENKLTVTDLWIDDGKLPGLTNSEIRWPFWRRQPNFRRKGIGRAVVSFVVAQASAKHYDEVRGDLSPKDLREFPDLGAWYVKQGFELLPGGKFNLGQVRMVLK